MKQQYFETLRKTLSVLTLNINFKYYYEMKANGANKLDDVEIGPYH